MWIIWVYIYDCSADIKIYWDQICVVSFVSYVFIKCKPFKTFPEIILKTSHCIYLIKNNMKGEEKDRGGYLIELLTNLDS